MRQCEIKFTPQLVRDTTIVVGATRAIVDFRYIARILTHIHINIQSTARDLWSLSESPISFLLYYTSHNVCLNYKHVNRDIPLEASCAPHLVLRVGYRDLKRRLEIPEVSLVWSIISTSQQIHGSVCRLALREGQREFSLITWMHHWYHSLHLVETSEALWSQTPLASEIDSPRSRRHRVNDPGADGSEPFARIVVILR